MTPQSFGAIRVPYTAAWTEEQQARYPTVVRWRCGDRTLPFISDTLNLPGKGKPLFKVLHADRCREVMEKDVCQMCVKPLSTHRFCITSGGTLQGLPLVVDGLPMHADCAVAAYRACPGLQRQQEAGRLRIFLLSGKSYLLVPKVLGIASGPEADERTNDLIRRHGRLYSGPDLQLRAFTLISLVQLEDISLGSSL